MNAGRFVGIILFVLGVPATIFGYLMLNDDGSILKIMLAGPALVLIGLAMLVFPGGDVTIQDINSKTKSLWGEAPMGHKIAWLLAGSIGIAFALVYFLGGF
jgi:hypothetical protein